MGWRGKKKDGRAHAHTNQIDGSIDWLVHWRRQIDYSPRHSFFSSPLQADRSVRKGKC